MRSSGKAAHRGLPQGHRGGGGVFNGARMAGAHNGLVVQHCMREAGQLQGHNQLVFPALLQLLHNIPPRVKDGVQTTITAV